ncbi:hypothetical protein [Yoonia sp. R2-816]|uniref:hypothetical protein n=1 Tax=Yoonia sp. R2-816 TaxID=3342638 RepID=UPI003727C5EC
MDRMVRTLFIVTFLAACGSGDDSSTSAAARLAAFDDAFADITAAGVTPVNQLPTEGSISYVGDMRLGLPLGPSGAVTPYLGRLQATVHFDDSLPPLSGTIGAFAGPQGALSGELEIYDGSLNPGADPDDDYQFAAKLTGRLSDGPTEYDLSGDVAGDFYGRTADAVAGVAFGTISDGSELDRFDGTFAAVSP